MNGLPRLEIDDDEPPYEISLRDMFAALVLPAVYADCMAASSGTPAEVARRSWKMAEEMMKGRPK